MIGIDVSHWQKKIAWDKVDANFAIIKCSESTNFIDPRFSENKKEARENGILCGFYHFARGGDAIKEADYFIKNVGEILPGELLVLDWEIKHADPVGWSLKFLDRCFEKVGFRPLIYMSSAVTTAHNWEKVYRANYGLWVARYGPNNGKIHDMLPNTGAWPFYALWQYTSMGSAKGIEGNVDLNHTDMSLTTLKQYGKPEATDIGDINSNYYDLFELVEAFLGKEYGDNLDDKDLNDITKKFEELEEQVESSANKITEQARNLDRLNVAVAEKTAEIEQLKLEQQKGFEAIGTIKLFQEALKQLINFK